MGGGIKTSKAPASQVAEEGGPELTQSCWSDVSCPLSLPCLPVEIICSIKDLSGNREACLPDLREEPG